MYNLAYKYIHYVEISDDLKFVLYIYVATPGIDFIDDIDNAVEFKFPGAFETVSDDFLINIINDNITEGDEALVCVLLAGILTELGGGILREDPDTIDILIRDDDRKYL